MTYHDIDNDSGDAIYNDWVRRRLLRTHSGLSMEGFMCLVATLVIAGIFLGVPTTEDRGNAAFGGVQNSTVPATTVASR